MRQHRRRAPLALIATTLIGLSANAHAALSFNCSETLTVDTTNGFVMRCTGQLDVFGLSATDPDSVLANSQFIRIEATQGLSLTKLTLDAPTIELFSTRKVELGLETRVLADTINIQVQLDLPGTPSGAVVHTSGSTLTPQPIVIRPDTSQELDPNRFPPLGGSVDLSSGANVSQDGPSGPATPLPWPGGEVVIHGDINGPSLVTNGTMTSTLQLVTPAVPEPSTWALLMGGMGLLAFMRRRGT